jgi:hypothetical protein
VKALTIRQPWAWATIYGGKDVENRRWRTAYRGPLLIHSGQNPDPDPGASARLLWTMVDPEAYGQPRPAWQARAAIIGVFYLADILRGQRLAVMRPAPAADQGRGRHQAGGCGEIGMGGDVGVRSGEPGLTAGSQGTPGSLHRIWCRQKPSAGRRLRRASSPAAGLPQVQDSPGGDTGPPGPVYYARV